MAMNPLVPLLAIGAVFLLSRGGGSPSLEAQAHSKFARLHELTGDSTWDVSKRPLHDVVQEFQVVMGATRQDGIFDAQTSSMLDEAISGYA